MVRYVSSLVLPFPRHRVFSLMADWTNLKVWDMNIVKSDLSPDQPTSPTPTPTPTAKGVRYDCAFKLASANRDPISVAYECVSFTPDCDAQFLGLATLFKSQDRVTCADVDGQPGHTKLTTEFNLSFRGLLSPFSFVMQGQMDKTGPLIMKDIDAFVRDRLAHQGDHAQHHHPEQAGEKDGYKQ